MSLRRTIRVFLFGAVLLLVTLLLTEALLHLAAAVWRPADVLTRQYPPVLTDEREIIFQGNPKWPGHDARGFRNPLALTKADVVAIGDSHTYGSNVASEEAWPAVLGVRLKTTVYNMALVGSGPLQNLEFLRGAAELHPTTVLFGMYFGNDLFDSFVFAQRQGRLTEFVSEGDRLSIDAAERAGPLAERVSGLFRSTSASAGPPAETRSVGRRLMLFLSGKSRLFGLLRTVKQRIGSRRILEPRFEDALAELSNVQRQYVSGFSDGSWKTILTSPYRLATLDQSDPRVRAGLHISMQAIRNMREFCAARGMTFIVVLLPTKEFVFQDRVRDWDSQPDYARLMEAEGQSRQTLVRFLLENHIAFVDPLPKLKSSVAQPYFENVDGHPNAAGHSIIATTIVDVMRDGR
jgi:hypothetical protein